MPPHLKLACVNGRSTASWSAFGNGSPCLLLITARPEPELICVRGAIDASIMQLSLFPQEPLRLLRGNAAALSAMSARWFPSVGQPLVKAPAPPNLAGPGLCLGNNLLPRWPQLVVCAPSSSFWLRRPVPLHVRCRAAGLCRPYQKSVNRAGRFSRKAVMPSCLSWVEKARPKASASSRRPLARSISCPALMVR